MKRGRLTILLACVALLCGASFWLGYRAHLKVAVTAHEQYAFQQHLLLKAMRVLQLEDARDPVQIVKESESDLFYSLDGITEIVEDLDPGDSRCLVLWKILDKLEEDLKKHPLKHKDTGELMSKIEALRKHRRL